MKKKSMSDYGDIVARKMWTRFCKLTGCREGRPSVPAICIMIATAMRRDEAPRGWAIQNVFEQTTLDTFSRVYDEFTPREPTPVIVPPGSGAKIKVMARRAEAGEELFHKDDFSERRTIYGPDHRRDAAASECTTEQLGIAAGM